MDEFGKITWSEERFRLENTLILMRESKEMSLFIFYTYNKKSSAQVKNHLLRVLNYLSEKGKLAKNRIVFLLSEGDEEKTVFQLVPQNSEMINIFQSRLSKQSLKSKQLPKLP